VNKQSYHRKKTIFLYKKYNDEFHFAEDGDNFMLVSEDSFLIYDKDLTEVGKKEGGLKFRREDTQEEVHEYYGY
jgi:hypothetical protein